MATTGGDILGFGNADNAVTARPARAIVRGDTDTWAKDCSSPDADDGTAWPADVFNDVLAQLRVALRSSAISLNGADDMLWRALQSVGLRYAADTGSASALVVANSVPVAAYGTGGLALLVKVGADATGATTINVDGLGAKSIKWPDNTALAAGDIKAGAVILIVYDGTKFQLLARMNGGGDGGTTGYEAGSIHDLATETVPAWALECDGSAVSRTTYARLFTAIGTRWGSGNGTTTFNLPDLRGRFRRSWDHGAGRDPDAAARTASNSGGATGDHVGSKQGGAAGPISLTGQTGTVTLPRINNSEGPGGTGVYTNSIGVLGTSDYSVAMNVSGNSGSTETRPANVNVLTVIAF